MYIDIHIVLMRDMYIIFMGI